ncbi:MAG: four-carbon acid sugar kinase family protein [Actinobacteria bacterium]|nr:four-carbon acid sugar kinase family protein [Actinomycetota bacterium]
MTTHQPPPAGPVWGAIADDLTGATDLAGNFAARGYATVVVLGAGAMADPTPALHGADCVVVALKSRTAPVAEAVRDSLAALDRLRAVGARRLYLKYCSTMDSTPQGNIGPVIDALLDALGETSTIVVPSFPDTGRTVYGGYLFVGSDLLADSSMRLHPLTPMTESHLPDLLRPQTRHAITKIALTDIRAGASSLRRRLRALPDGTLAVLDAIDNEDLATIAEASFDLGLVTGGSGIALGLPPREDGDGVRRITSAGGRRVVLSGSASQRSREQLIHARGRLPSRTIDSSRLDENLSGYVDELAAWVAERWREDPRCTPLIASVDDLTDFEPGQVAPAAARVEELLGELSRRLVDAGARQLVIAGGETSGAIAAALGVQALRVGPPVAPGVCWTEARTGSGELVNLLLKSGNFGDTDLFVRAWEILDTKEGSQ